MKFLLESFGYPILLGLLVTWTIFGTYRGTGVRDDYTWMIGVIVAAVGVHLQLRLARLQRNLESLKREREGENSSG